MAPHNPTPPSNFDSDSPYYVHSSDSPSYLIITPKLNGTNHLAWHRSMQRALGAKNKLVFIDGFIPIPDIEDLNHQAWERCNHLFHSWILNSVIESIAHIIVVHDTALSAWEDLKEHFYMVDRVRILSLRSTINNLKHVVHEESQNVVFSAPPTIDESSISINASDARRFPARGKGAPSIANGKNN